MFLNSHIQKKNCSFYLNNEDDEPVDQLSEQNNEAII